jgi:uncharacterized protein YdhG (YjbR/CyaY superfamily)
MPRPTFSSVDEYIVAQPPAAQKVLKRVRSILRKALPKSEEGISYQIPTYKLGSKMVIYFAGFKEHYSLYPATGRLTEEVPEAAAYKHSKGTLRFSYADPIPEKLIAAVAKFRAEEATKGKR